MGYEGGGASGLQQTFPLQMGDYNYYGGISKVTPCRKYEDNKFKWQHNALTR